MADDLRMALGELLRKAQGARDADVLREGVRVLSQALMELEVAQHVGAERYERTGESVSSRPIASFDWETQPRREHSAPAMEL